MNPLKCAPPNVALEITEMLFLNLETSILSRSEYFLSEPLDRATWLSLMFLCATEENGGRIPDCRKWGNDTWQQAARVRLKEVNRQCALWFWDGNDLVLRFYPGSQEREVQRKRKDGTLGGRPKRNRGAGTEELNESGEKPSGSPESEPQGSAACETESNGKKRKEKERNVCVEDAHTHAFPRSEEEAISRGAEAGFDPLFIAAEWAEAAARGGRCFKDIPIRNWEAYLKMQQEYRAKAPGRTNEGAPRTAASGNGQGLKAMQEELAHVKAKLRDMLRPNPDVSPEEFAEVERIKAPLRARRDVLIALIHEATKGQT